LPGWFRDGLPLTRPPYARVIAMDLNTGTIAWRVPFGDHPAVREQLESLGVTPKAPLGALGPPGLIATKSGLLFVGGGDRAFHALDARDGRELWSAPTLETTGTPMTYATASGRQFVVVATGRGPEATLVAFSLP
jgi:quinoprotein glucose dehydrogenase